MTGNIFCIIFQNGRRYIFSKWQAMYCYIILKTSKWQAMYDGEECSVGKATVVAADEECKVRSLCNCNCGCFRFCSFFILESSFDIKQCLAHSKYKQGVALSLLKAKCRSYERELSVVKEKQIDKKNRLTHFGLTYSTIISTIMSHWIQFCCPLNLTLA